MSDNEAGPVEDHFQQAQETERSCVCVFLLLLNRCGLFLRLIVHVSFFLCVFLCVSRRWDHSVDHWVNNYLPAKREGSVHPRRSSAKTRTERVLCRERREPVRDTD